MPYKQISPESVKHYVILPDITHVSVHHDILNVIILAAAEQAAIGGRAHTHTHVSMYVYIYIYIYTHTYIYIHTYCIYMYLYCYMLSSGYYHIIIGYAI